MNRNQSIQSSVFKKTSYGDLQVDSYTGEGEARGCIAFLHGGALLLGSRKDLPPQVISYLMTKGWDVASLDYRSAPEVGIEEILTDVEDGCRFLRERYNESPIFLVGYSAGAYLSLLYGAKGFLVDGICAFAGYGNLSAPWYYQSSEFFTRYKNVDHLEERIVKGEKFSTLEEKIDLYVYLRQKGKWPEYVLGRKDLIKKAQEFSPINHISSRYPPTVLIHGDADWDVPVTASIEMAQALKEKDIPCKLVVLNGLEHDLFMQLDRSEVVTAWNDALEFLMASRTMSTSSETLFER